MAYKKDIKPLLTRLGLTENDMDKIWNELLETNHKVQLFNRLGKTWRDMTISVIETLPTQKARDELRMMEIEEKEKQEKLEKEKELEYRIYYQKNFEKIMVDKIDNHIDLTEEELERITSFAIETNYGDLTRWSRPATSIIELCERYFQVDWDNGLTENQPDEYWNQPFEVVGHEEIETITFNVWRKVNE